MDCFFYKWQLQNYKLYNKTVCGCDEFHSFFMFHYATYSWIVESLSITDFQLKGPRFGLLLSDLSPPALLLYFSRVIAQTVFNHDVFSHFLSYSFHSKKKLYQDELHDYLFVSQENKYTVVKAGT